MTRRPFFFLFILCCLWLGAFPQNNAAARAPLLATTVVDLISPQFDSGQCLTVSGDIAANTPVVTLTSCRGNLNQQWAYSSGASQWQTQLDPTYCLATVNNSPGAGGRLTVRPCNDSRALTLQPNPTLTDSYQLAGSAYVLDAGVYGYVALAHQNGWSYQYWRWLQPDLDAVNGAGCEIVYPLAAIETATYTQELACDRVAKLQPPYVMPRPELIQRTLFPGPVTTTLTVTHTYPFDLNFKSHSYLRQSWAPANWQGTGLYAPPGAILRVTVSDATAAELANVYLRIGVHTDQLSPTSGNVAGGTFLRYPNVIVRVKLEPGENLVRSPYGGPIILDGGSGAGVNKVITVEIANGVEAPYFHAGVTTEAEWLARRNAPVPYAEIGGEKAVIHVPSAEVRNLSYADVLAVANYYTAVGHLHNELSGLAPTEVALHQPPLGKYRHVEDIQISGGWGHSGFPAMYFNAWQIGVPAVSVYRSDGWGVWHELGHNYQMGLWSGVYGTEVTVNLWSLYAQEKLYGNSRLIDSGTYAAAIAHLNDPLVIDKWGTADAFQQLVFLDQIRLAFPQLNWNLWTELIRRYRAMDTTEVNSFSATDQGKRDKFLTVLCEITGTNLTPHFAAWTIQITQAAKDACAAYTPLTVASWLLDGAQPLYNRGDGTGEFVREWWTGISGTALADLSNSVSYPSTPTAHAILTGTIEGPHNWGSNYGEKLRGYLHPPVTGDYEFWLAGDDAVQFWLSSDADPIHATPSLTLTTASGYRNFDQYVNAVQRSAKVPLTGGQRYYFEVIHKEGSGGDHVAVAWTIPAGPGTPLEARKVIDGRFLSPYAGEVALQASKPVYARPGDDVELTLDLLNQGTATVGAVDLMATIPPGFTLSPLDNHGWASGYRYVRFVAESEAGSRGDWASMAELGLLDATGVAIPNDDWRVVYVDSENGDGLAVNAIDGDPATIWHTKWWGGTDPYPHELQVDLGARVLPTGFTYLPRQEGGNGRVGNYRFDLSVDGVKWIEVAQGTFADNSQLKQVTFAAPPPPQLFTRVVGSLAPGASTIVKLTLRAVTTATLGVYTVESTIVNAWDGRNSPLYDQNLINNQSETVVNVVDQLPTPTPAVTLQPTTTPTPHPTSQPTGAPLPTATPTLSSPTSADADFDTLFDALECVAVEPCPDLDQDGQPDHRDIDSDGDGIVDRIEANALQAAGQTMTPLDSDSDGIPDYLDLDSDNDTIPDATEGHDANSDGQPDHKGMGQDRDGDGLDDGYDTLASTAFNAENAMGSNATLPNHSGGQPDWRNPDDDGDGLATRDEVASGMLDPNGNGTPDYLEAAQPRQVIYLPFVTR